MRIIRRVFTVTGAACWCSAGVVVVFVAYVRVGERRAESRREAQVEAEIEIEALLREWAGG